MVSKSQARSTNAQDEWARNLHWEMGAGPVQRSRGPLVVPEAVAQYEAGGDALNGNSPYGRFLDFAIFWHA